MKHVTSVMATSCFNSVSDVLWVVSSSCRNLALPADAPTRASCSASFLSEEALRASCMWRGCCVLSVLALGIDPTVEGLARLLEAFLDGDPSVRDGSTAAA